MTLATSQEFRYPGGEPRKYYRCANNKVCNVVCGAHPDGTPLGVPGNAATRSARIELHQVFDPLWTTGRWSRAEAYVILQLLTGLGQEEAHIARFDQEQCERVGEQIEEFLDWNAPRDQPIKGAEVVPRHRFVYVRRECAEHGSEVHRVYLESRQEFCMNCLNRKQGPVWGRFLVFVQERQSRYG
jgi:hypothetical protein